MDVTGECVGDWRSRVLAQAGSNREWINEVIIHDKADVHGRIRAVGQRDPLDGYWLRTYA